jgi:hypothetical protein
MTGCDVCSSLKNTFIFTTRTVCGLYRNACTQLLLDCLLCSPYMWTLSALGFPPSLCTSHESLRNRPCIRQFEARLEQCSTSQLLPFAFPNLSLRSTYYIFHYIIWCNILRYFLRTDPICVLQKWFTHTHTQICCLPFINLYFLPPAVFCFSPLYLVFIFLPH